MIASLRIRGWDKWQSYRKDRGTPPWIKVHRVLLTNAEWAVLTDAEKGQLVSLWLIAADKGGEIPGDPRVLRKVCMLDEEPNINKFIELGFIDGECQPSDNQVTTTCQPSDAPETETETETDNYIVEQKTRQQIPFKEIVSFLNETTGKDYKASTNGTKSHISARWSEGFRLDDFKTVICAKNTEWKGDPDMEKYIRPQTLFGAKFESYLQAAKETVTEKKSTWVKNDLFKSTTVPY